MMKDFRKSSRVDAQLFISYDLLDEKEQVTQSGMALSRDLSRKGVRMEDRTPYPVDAHIRLHLAVGDEVVDIDGQVRHVEKESENKYHIGIEFSQLKKELIERVAEFYPDILKE